MIVWGLPVFRLRLPHLAVDTITNLSALKHFDATMRLPVNDNHQEMPA